MCDERLHCVFIQEEIRLCAPEISNAFHTHKCFHYGFSVRDTGKSIAVG